jgi:hypothetical protein
VVAFYGGEDIPVFMLAVINKGERANLSRQEQNELRKDLTGVAADYRAGVKAKAAELKRRGPKR